VAPHLRAAAVAVIALAVGGSPLAAQRERIRDRLQARTVRPASTVSVSIVVGCVNRRYLLHAPASHGSPLPLVVALHGGSQTAADMERMTGLSTAADREQFIAVYPEGIDKSWADGRGTTSSHAIDRARVFAAGASNGGTMAHRLGCELSDLIVAIGPVIAAMPSKLAPTCKPAVPVAVMGIQGTADPLMPFEGGDEGAGSARHLGAGGRIESARTTQELWRSIDGCNAAPSVSALPPHASDGTSVTRRAYSGCRGGADVVWYEIEGGGHRWPPQRARGPVESLADRAFGVSSQNLDATASLWEFFRAHPRR
jgi:polyhydroxybutyrate depolymerase